MPFFLFHCDSQGLQIFEDGRYLFERPFASMTDPCVPELSVQHLTPETELGVFMRDPRVILADGTEMLPFTPPVVSGAPEGAGESDSEEEWDAEEEDPEDYWSGPEWEGEEDEGDGGVFH